MKKFKFLFSVAVASAIVGCSSMDVDEDEALAGNFPEDFTDAAYLQIHPELVRVQIKDYVTDYNAKLADKAKEAGDEAKAAFDSAKAADDSAFAALDTAVLHSIMTDPYLGGYTQKDWETDWGGGTKDTTIITTRKDTLSLTVGDSADPSAAQAVIVALRQKASGECVTIGKSVLCDTTKSVGSLEYDADGKLVAVHGYSKCDSATATCDAADTLDVTLTATSFVKKPSKSDTVTVVVSVENKTLDVAGGISAVHMKALNALNMVDTRDDYKSLKAVPIDTFAISYQYVIYGRDHGWPYRPCTEAEKANPVITEEYPVTKLYCDDNGLAREIN